VKRIGLLAESSLHATLKSKFTSPGDFVEFEIMGSIVDVFKHIEIVEIQTGSFGNIKSKISKLAQVLPVRVVLPLAAERFISKFDTLGNMLSRRRSPKKARYEDLFSQIIYLGPWIIGKPITLEVVMVSDEIIWQNDGKGSWRRKGWSITDRRLINTLSSREFQSKDDYASLLPTELPQRFSVKHLAEYGKLPLRLSGQMLYFLAQINSVERLGREGRAYIYKRST